MTVCRQCGTANEVGTITCFKCKTSLIAAHMIGKIPCSVHANREATSSCNTCGHRLCDACAYVLGGIDFCEGCAPEGAINPEHDEDYEQIPVVSQADLARASMWDRSLGAVTDLGVLAAFGAALALLFAMFNGGMLYRIGYRYLVDTHRPAFWIFWILVLVAFVTYHIILVAMDGRTLGKRIAGVIVLQEDGRIADLQEILVRSASIILSLLPLGLGFFWAFWDKNHETWHDKLSKTGTFRYEDTT
jgi:uncharacterized RDD family membrane protein YckC